MTQNIRNTPIAFDFTSDMHTWLNQTHFDGVCMVYDRWTWGLTRVDPSNHSGIGNYSSLTYCQEVK